MTLSIAKIIAKVSLDEWDKKPTDYRETTQAQINGLQSKAIRVMVVAVFLRFWRCKESPP
jgi:hypothetical protein